MIQEETPYKTPYTEEEVNAIVRQNEELRKKYDNVLEKAEKIYHSEFKPDEAAVLAKYLPILFPELKKESEDEKIKREIVAYINELADLKNEKIPTKWLDWLEEQGKKDKLIRELSEYKVKYTQKVLQEGLNKDAESQSQLKFKVRDWTVDDFGYFWRVTKVLSNHYELEGDDGVKSTSTREYVDEKYHLWTIDDAKKGDILVIDGIWIVEFDKNMTDGCSWKDASILTSFVYDMDDNICTLGSHMFYKEIWPASKEDIDLFKKKRNEYLESNSHNESKFKVGDKV